ILVAKQGSALPRHTRTNQCGEYGIDDLLTGQYVITASSSDGPGEGAQSLPIELEEEHVRPSTITLEGVGPEPSPAAQIPMPPATLAQGEKIAGLAHTADVSRTGNFVDLQLHSLPVGGSSTMRSFDELAFLLAGVAPPPFTPGVRGPGVGFGIGTAGQFSVNGSRARSNTFSVDGSDNNDPDVGVRRQGFVALVPQSLESIREV